MVSSKARARKLTKTPAPPQTPEVKKMSVLTTPAAAHHGFFVPAGGPGGLCGRGGGGGGLTPLPAYMATGIPMHYVYGCNKLSSAIGITFSTARFFKNGALRVGLLVAAASFLGSGIASQVVLFFAGQGAEDHSAHPAARGGGGDPGAAQPAGNGPLRVSWRRAK